jgi:hypothetical protein
MKRYATKKANYCCSARGVSPERLILLPLAIGIILAFILSHATWLAVNIAHPVKIKEKVADLP